MTPASPFCCYSQQDMNGTNDETYNVNQRNTNIIFPMLIALLVHLGINRIYLLLFCYLNPPAKFRIKLSNKKKTIKHILYTCNHACALKNLWKWCHLQFWVVFQRYIFKSRARNNFFIIVFSLYSMKINI